ncbi:porin family protein [Flavivirga eckloniae]|uniref:Outer membrane protein beta-barrel domain-containing protein n=1 Tax=Flavivirga eckloniae TaxID=1803846 RepID=A0A2K9PNY4_9FLAO|nr:outer membrane beta-barrel protein [Flavivirga eckloniae]AUP78790.1 hypothetical protein C1H87_08790 [Flavivirga eckloniae]
MKQKVLLILTICFLTKTYSQNKNSNFQLSLGSTLSVPKTSKLVNTNIEGNPEIKSSINLGFYILPSINYPLSKKTSLDFGLGFYLDRFSIEEINGYVTNKVNRNVSQIQIPININLHFGNNNTYQFGAGGFANFLVSAKEKGESQIKQISTIGFISDNDKTNTNLTQNYNNDIEDRYNTFSFGTFIQLKKTISFSSNKKGFILLRINQYFNSIKSYNLVTDAYQFTDIKAEKEPTTVNIGVGIAL